MQRSFSANKSDKASRSQSPTDHSKLKNLKIKENDPVRNKNTRRKELFSFYIDLLMKVEKLRFNLGEGEEKFDEEQRLREYMIDFEDFHVEEREKVILEEMSKRFGRSYYSIYLLLIFFFLLIFLDY